MNNNNYSTMRSKVKFFLLSLVSMLSLLLLQNISADNLNCSPFVSQSPQSVVIDYDPFLPGSSVQKLEFELTNDVDETCIFDLAISPNANNPALFFNVNDTNVVMEIRPSSDGIQLMDTSIPGVYRVELAALSEEQFVFDVLVTEDAVAAAQDHVVPIQLQMRQISSTVPIGQDWYSDVILRSIPRAQLNITGASGSFGDGTPMSFIDFGVAESGESKKVFIQIRANTLSQLTIDSFHNGKLLHKEETNSDIKHGISYTAQLDGEEIDLNIVTIKKYDIPHTYKGESLPFELTLGDISGVMAGEYEDTLTIEFSPL